MDASAVENLVRSAIPDADVRAVDLRGSGDHFELTVVAEAFTGLSMVEQHRMVYAALGDAMQAAIHAVVLKTMTPDQYRQGLVRNL